MKATPYKWTPEQINHVVAEVAVAPYATSTTETTLVSLDGGGLLGFRRSVVDQAALAEELAMFTPASPMPAIPTGDVQIAVPLLEIIQEVEGVVSATFDDENAIEVVAADAVERDALLLRIDRALRACVGQDADRISFYLS